jgi:hypothetical protein
VNKTIARYASAGWEALDMAALRKTYCLTGGLFFHRHGITILFRKVAAEAVQPELLPETQAGQTPARGAVPEPENASLPVVPVLARS